MTKRWMPLGRGMLAVLMLIFVTLHLSAFDWEREVWWDIHGVAVRGECEACGEHVWLAKSFDGGPNEAADAFMEIYEELETRFCDDCGYCTEETNSECYYKHHCHDCGECIDDPWCEACYKEDRDLFLCSSCGPQNTVNHCNICNKHLEADVPCCECLVPFPHCEECSELKCSYCNVCMIIGGNETEYGENGCFDHAICYPCLEDGVDPDHCKLCHNCGSQICELCGLCEDCYSMGIHCPLCDECYGDDGVQWCNEGGEHCTDCCEENVWLCEQCDRCTEALGLWFCDDCGLCIDCCLQNSEDEGCIHQYCIMSDDYDYHLCLFCQECPQDTECEYCGLCEECQPDYHCEHEICPESDEWDEHLCTDCGDCFEPDELCEYCGRCEGCTDSYHCEHGYCPDDSSFDDGDHFICEQCGNCFEDLDRCEYCELCNDCCLANTETEGCEHELCVESPDFADHWCYADYQCLEKCSHNAECEHENVSTEWASDNNAHWHVCLDCGTTISKAFHTPGEPVITSEPNSERHRNGKANVFCTICAQYVCTITIPYVPIPEDGSPYIIDQPKDYEGKVSDVAFNEKPRYATYNVRAGGKNLSYQWYRTIGSATPTKLVDNQGDYWFEISGKADVSGATTKSLTVFVYGSSCYDTYEYYCVVSNDKGSVTSKRAKQKAQHVFNRYEGIDASTHKQCCAGDGCEEVKKISKHRLGDWTLIRPATSMQTGLYEQKCTDCGYKKQTVIPKVEQGHVHTFDQPRYRPENHWFVCKCGVSSPDGPQAHSFGAPVVTRPATEKRTGERQLTCSVCDYIKVETIDKLPHTHDYWQIDLLDQDPKKWGRAKEYHYFYCKSGDGAMIKEPHDGATFTWAIVKAATATDPGRMRRYCGTCGYMEYKSYDAGTYPVFVLGGTASHVAAAPGTTVTVTYTKELGMKWGSHTHWMDMSSSSEYSEYGLKPISFYPGTYSSTISFVMPNGPVMLIVYNVEFCNHTGNKVMGERVEPTCKGYGHEPDKLCADCGEVVEPGARIDALGHDLPYTPIEGTKIVEYCSIYSRTEPHTVPNEETHGYSGDFICKRCGETVKGKRTPLKHGLHDKNKIISMGLVWTKTHLENEKEATCTSDGYTGDIYCDYCGKVAERGEKYERLGHEWGEWEVVREATKTVKGMEQRICNRDGNHKETRITDYSGPDYRLKADKTMLNFEFTYGDTSIEPQSVTFTSVGRNEVIEIDDSEANTLGSMDVDGLKLTVSLITNERDIDDIMAIPAKDRKVKLISVVTADGITTTDFVAPTISYTVTMNKANPQLRIEKRSVVARIGCPFMSPEVTSPRMEDFTISWRSLNNSVATINAQTGEVTPLSAGTATIMGYFAGDEHFKVDRVFYTVTVIGEQQFAGSLWQVYVAGSNQAVIGPTDHTLAIKPSTSGAGKVDVSYGAFVLASSRDRLSGFTVSGVDVSDMEDGRVFYDLPDSKRITIPTRSGFMMADVTMEGSQMTFDGTPIMILYLTVGGKDNVIVFGPEGMTLEQLYNAYTTGVDEIRSETKSDAIYDLSGRRVEKIKQPGIYIKSGKKVLVK